MSWSWGLAACGLVVLDRLLMAYRWIALLAPVRRRPPLVTLLRVFFVSTFIGTFLVQSIGSDAVRTWALSRDGVPLAQSLASVLMDRLLGVISLLLAAAAGLAIVPSLAGDSRVTWSFSVTVAGCLLALAFVFSPHVDDFIRRRLVRRRVSRLRDVIGRLLDGLQAYRAERGVMIWVLVASVAVQILRVLQAWMLGRSLGIETTVTGYFAFIPIILLVMLLPVTVNGLGTSQVAFVWSFGHLGVAPPQAIALSLLFVALGILGNLPGGLLYALGPSRASLPGAPTEPPGGTIARSTD
jgi:uncharacterized protein (TIRG00374 family)